MTDNLMEVPALLDIQGVEGLSRISYWQYIRFNKCILSGLYPRNVRVDRRFTSTETYGIRQLSGIVFHKILEEMPAEISKNAKGDKSDLEKYCFDKIREVEKKISLETGDVRYEGALDGGEGSKIIKSIKSVLDVRIKNHQAESGDISRYPEKMFYSKDGTVCGKPDLVVKKGDWIKVLDYKLVDLERITSDQLSDYKNQIHLYSYLLKDNFGIYPKEAEIIGLSGKKLEIELNEQNSDEVYLRLKVYLDQVNRVVERNQHSFRNLCSPGDDPCSYCQAKPLCPALRESNVNVNLPKKSHFVVGYQHGQFRYSRRGGAIISIKPMFRTFGFSSELITLSKIQKERFPSLTNSPGQLIVATNFIANQGDVAAMAGFDSRIVAIEESNLHE